MDRQSGNSVTTKNLSYLDGLSEYIESGIGTPLEKFQNFAKYVPRQHLTYFLVRYELFKKILDVHGSIIECGVFLGGGLLSFAQLSAIFEPVNHQRRIIGFDSFEGFPELDAKDGAKDKGEKKVGGLASHAHDDILRAIELFDANRFIGQIPKVSLVKGDATQTIPKFIEENPHTVVSMLYLDFDLYPPTKAALRHFVPRMPKGGIIGFDTLNMPDWPGETVALLEELGINNLRIQRFPFDSHASYAVIE
jgi:hypothetical protein